MDSYHSDADAMARLRHLADECVAAAKGDPERALRELCNMAAPFRPDAPALLCVLRHMNGRLGGKVPDTRLEHLAGEAAPDTSAQYRALAAHCDAKRAKRLKRLAAKAPTVSAVEGYHARRPRRGRVIPPVQSWARTTTG